jgi:hypothetical protein
MAEPKEDVPDPDLVQRQMHSAIERIRAKLVEPEAKPKSDHPIPEDTGDELS